MSVLLILSLIFVYFLPSIIADLRNKKNSGVIFAINLFLGWSLIGWVVPLILAVMHEERAPEESNNVIRLNIPTKLPLIGKWYILTKSTLVLLLPFFPLLLVDNTIVSILFLFYIIFIYLPVVTILFLDYKFFNFIVENDKIIINSGIIIKRSNSFLFDKVQNVEITRGALMRLFGISKVNIWTSSPEQIQVYQEKTVYRPAGGLILATADSEWLKNSILRKYS